jgi:alpha-aminoadipic semialdehyde synthase
LLCSHRTSSPGVQDHHILEKNLLSQRFSSVPVSNALSFEGIANRDSYPYAGAYALPPGIRTLLRGTLRYPGYCELVQAFKRLGLLSTQPLSAPLRTWSALVPQTLGVGISDGDGASARSAVLDTVDRHQAEQTVAALEWLSLLPAQGATTSALPPLPTAAAAPVDLLATLLAHKLRYEPSERDLVVLAHEVVARPAGAPPGAAEEVHTSQLVTYGTPRASAMSRTVGLPVAFAALRVLDGQVAVRGVHGP